MKKNIDMFQKAMLSNTKVIKSAKPATKRATVKPSADSVPAYTLTPENEKSLLQLCDQFGIAPTKMVNLAVEMLIDSSALLKPGK